MYSDDLIYRTLSWRLRIGDVNITFDGTAPGVIVPVWLLDRTAVTLQIGHDLPIPIPDLKVELDRVSGTLSFKGEPFFCSVPFSAIVGVGPGQFVKTVIPPEPAEVHRLSDYRRKTSK